MRDDEIATYADPAFEQHFLTSLEKVTKLLDAAGILTTDNVVEIGAGVGSIARHVPECRSLTLIELDARLMEPLRRNAPGAKIIQGDALGLIQQIPCDVLLSNLPNSVTESLVEILHRLSFRTAVMAVGESTDLTRLEPHFAWSEVTRISGDDFSPPQPSTSRLVKVTPIR